MRVLHMTMKAAALAAGLFLGLSAPTPAMASGEDTPHPPHVGLSSQSLLGGFDQAAAQRGFLVFNNVCNNCHTLRQLYFRNLREIGLSEDQVKALAAAIQVTDGPNDEGQMFERPGRPSDHFRSPFANVQAARAANHGAAPPDLSVIVKARENGADYLYGLLTGYGEAPHGMTMAEGMSYNRYFPGNQIAMASPLSGDGLVEYADGTRATVDQMARDVTAFLAWAAEPELEARKRMGLKVLIYLAVLGGLAYGVKRKVWSNAH